MGYLPKKGVSFELIEFTSGGRTVQGGIFGPDPKLFQEPGTAVVLVHGVEGYWYAGPTMFLGCYLAEYRLCGARLQRCPLWRELSNLEIRVRGGGS